MIGKIGAFGVPVAKNTAAIIPDQWGGMTAQQLAPYIGQISGYLGLPAPPGQATVQQLLFSSVTDVIGGQTPKQCPPTMGVRECLEQLNPNTLIIEIPGSRDQGVKNITLKLPVAVPCPTGTKEVSP